jgi:hypothetical protein
MSERVVSDAYLALLPTGLRLHSPTVAPSSSNLTTYRSPKVEDEARGSGAPDHSDSATEWSRHIRHSPSRRNTTDVGAATWWGCPSIV